MMIYPFEEWVIYTYCVDNLLNKMQIRYLGVADCICHFDFVVMLRARLEEENEMV